jgi:hypothetical protein
VPGYFTWLGQWELLLLSLLFLAVGLLVGAVMPQPKSHAPGAKSMAIMELALAWTPGYARDVLQRWSELRVLGKARLGVEVDFLFLLCYPMFGALLITFIARIGEAHHHLGFDTADAIAKSGAIAIGVAGLLDVLENVGLLFLIPGKGRTQGLQTMPTPSAWLVEPTSVASTAKFVLAAGTLWLGLATGGVVLVRAI